MVERAEGKVKSTKSRMWYVVFLVGVVLVLVGLTTCSSCSKTGQKKVTTKKVTPQKDTNASTPDQAVQQFYDADTKQGVASFQSGTGEPERVKFWFDGGKYRLTWYRENNVRLHMICTDGTKVYHSDPAKKTSVISYVAAEKQQWTFNGPPNWTPEAGVKEGEYTVFTYMADKLWDIEGASQKFYLYDLTVYAKGTTIDKIAMRTNSTKVPVADLVDSQFTIEEFELNVPIDQTMFELPYPVVKAE